MPQNRQAEVGSATGKSRLGWARRATIASAVLALLLCVLFAASVISNWLENRVTPSPGGYVLDGPPPPASMYYYAVFALLLIGAILALRRLTALPLLLAWLSGFGVMLISSVPILASMFENLNPLSVVAMIASEGPVQVWLVGFLLALAGFVLREKQMALTQS